MSAELQLDVIRGVHTFAVALNALAILHVIYCGLTGRIGVWTWVSVGYSAFIAIGLAINSRVCPLQTLAQHVAGTDRWVRDLFFLNEVAHLIAPVLGTGMAIGYGLVAWRLWRRRG